MVLHYRERSQVYRVGYFLALRGYLRTSLGMRGGERLYVLPGEPRDERSRGGDGGLRGAGG